MTTETAELSFALASCQYPAGLLDREVAEASYRRLALRLDKRSTKAEPRMLLLLGDQVYVDATAGLFDPTERHDRFVRPYERLYGSVAVRQVMRRLPVYAMLDDHEIEDNWEPVIGEPRPDPVMAAGRESYLQFQRDDEPPPVPPIGDSRVPLWYTFAEDVFPFFMADTRTERDPRTAATIETARIMSDAQFEAILHWLSRQPGDIPKFIASPAILLPRRLRATRGRAGALRSDAWDGYPHSLYRLLAFIAEKRIENVVFLSGDEHLSCVARARIEGRRKGNSASILSVHSSALYAPFPFANSVPADFDDRPEFGFDLADATLGATPEQRQPWACDVGGGYRCEVSTEFAAPGDGFAILRVLRDGGKWKVCCEFVREPGTAQGKGSRQIDRFL